MIGWLGRNGGPLVLRGGGRVFVEGDGDVAENLEVERAAWLQLERGLVSALGDLVVLGEERNIAQLFAQSGIVRRKARRPLQELRGGGQVLPADGKARQLQQPFHPLWLSTRRQLEVVERLHIVFLVAVVVGPISFDLGALVGRSFLGEVGALGKLRTGVVIPAHVGERFAVEGSGQGRVRRGLDGRRPVSRRGLDVIVPVLHPCQDAEDEAIMGSDLLRFERFVEGGFLLRFVVEDQRIGRVIHGVLWVCLDQLLQLSCGRCIFVLEHQVERGLRARTARLGSDGVASGQ